MRYFLLALAVPLLCIGQDHHPITNRPIPHVMGAAGADWLVRPEREAEEHPSVALDEIGIERNSVVADIGAGAGYYTALLADRVGPAGKVFAVDVQPRMLKLLRERVSAHNVEPILGSDSDPKLTPGSVDLELLVDVYHEFSRPQSMLRHLRAALRPGGRLVLLEYRGEDPAIPIHPEHKMTVEQVLAEVQPSGFRLVRRSEKLPRQHILIFEPAGEK